MAVAADHRAGLRATVMTAGDFAAGGASCLRLIISRMWTGTGRIVSGLVCQDQIPARPPVVAGDQVARLPTRRNTTMTLISNRGHPADVVDTAVDTDALAGSVGGAGPGEGFCLVPYMPTHAVARGARTAAGLWSRAGVPRAMSWEADRMAWRGNPASACPRKARSVIHAGRGSLYA